MVDVIPSGAEVGLEIEMPLRLGDVDEHEWSDTADLVVVGLGGAGVSAALEALELGAEVIAVDRYAMGGSSAANGGVYYAGGGTPIWSRNGRELFYLADRQIMVSDYTVRGSSFEASKPRLWSKQRLLPTAFMSFDLAPDGRQSAVVPDSSVSPTEVRVTMLLNFFDELRRRVT